MNGTAFTLQLFVAFSGLRVLADLLTLDDETTMPNVSNNLSNNWSTEVVDTAIEGIWRVIHFHEHMGTAAVSIAKRDVMELFIPTGVLMHLARALVALSIRVKREYLFANTATSVLYNSTQKPSTNTALNRETTTISRVKELIDRCCKILEQFANTENPVVKEHMAHPDICRKLVKGFWELEASVRTKVLRIIKTLSQYSGTLSGLDSSGVIPLLCEVLKRSEENQSITSNMHFHAVQALVKLTRLDRPRQAQAAHHGATEPLMEFVKTKNQLQDVAIPILCDFAHASKESRNELWKHEGVQFFLMLLEHEKYQHYACDALEALHAWIVADSSKQVLDLLERPAAVEKLALVFERGYPKQQLLAAVEKILVASKTITVDLGGDNSRFLKCLVERLKDLEKYPEAQVRLNLLRLLRVLTQHRTNALTFVQNHGLLEIVANVEKIATKDKARMVTVMAKQLLEYFDQQAQKKTKKKRFFWQTTQDKLPEKN